jgi:uncharacterized metal-binding protein
METNNNSESVYIISEETSRCINVLKKLIAVQEETLNFLTQQGISDSREGEMFAENMGIAVSQFRGILQDGIYDKIINGEFEL